MFSAGVVLLTLGFYAGMPPMLTLRKRKQRKMCCANHALDAEFRCSLQVQKAGSGISPRQECVRHSEAGLLADMRSL